MRSRTRSFTSLCTMMALPSGRHIDLGNGSDLLYFEKFFDVKEAYTYLEGLDKEVKWVRPTLSVYGRKCEQPRETCYVADEGLPMFKYSGFQPVVHKWDDFPTLKTIACAVHDALPGYSFNSVLINKYASGSDYAGWHADDEKVYGLTSTIASVSLGAEREFLIRRKRTKKPATISCTPRTMLLEEPKRLEGLNAFDVLLGKSKHHPRDLKRKSCMSSIEETKADECPVNGTQSFILKSGSLFVMRGYTQRDWEHSVPRRKKVHGLRINLTFRRIVSES